MSLKVGVDVSANVTDEDKRKNQRILCTFYGDVNLPGPIPLDYTSAVDAYKVRFVQIFEGIHYINFNAFFVSLTKRCRRMGKK